MLGLTHMMVGISCGLVIAQTNGADPLQTAALATVGGIGALLPDIDEPNSMINFILFPMRFVAMFIPHRGFTHSFLALILLEVALFALEAATKLPRAYFFAFWIGYLSHIVADALTVRGVPLLWPFPYRVRVPLITTGGVLEVGLQAVILVGMFVLFIRAVM